jgi:CHAT domain-containing protein
VVDGKRLIETHDLSLIPSAAVLVALEARRGETTAPAVLGDPLDNLPAARSEARWVATQVGASALIGGAATSTALLAARHASLLHVSSHAELSRRGAFLRLADRALSAAEIVEAGLAPQLVVLASCASAAAPDAGPWGALSTSFLAAGSHNVIGSLWSLEDEPTRIMVERFYRGGGAEHPAHALAIAQRASIAAGEPRRAWAGFVIVGTGVVVR